MAQIKWGSFIKNTRNGRLTLAEKTKVQIPIFIGTSFATELLATHCGDKK